MKKFFMAVIAFMMTISASAQFYIYYSDGSVAKVDSISMVAPTTPENPEDRPDESENDTLLNNFTLGGYGLFGSPEMIAGTDTVLEISIGAVKCQLAMGLYYIWDDGIAMAGYSLTGAGFLATVEAPTYVIVEGDYAGYYISAGELVVDTVPEDVYAPYTGQAGQLLDVQMYGDGWKALLAAKTQEDSIAAAELIYGAQTGTQLFYIDFDNNVSQNFNCANVSFANIYDDPETGEIRYSFKLEWYDFVNENRLYGLACNTEVNEEGELVVTSLVEPYDLRVIHKEYTNIPTVEKEKPAKAPVLKPMKKNLYKNQNPIPTILGDKVMYKNI